MVSVATRSGRSMAIAWTICPPRAKPTAWQREMPRCASNPMQSWANCCHRETVFRLAAPAGSAAIEDDGSKALWRETAQRQRSKHPTATRTPARAESVRLGPALRSKFQRRLDLFSAYWISNLSIRDLIRMNLAVNGGGYADVNE